MNKRAFTVDFLKACRLGEPRDHRQRYVEWRGEVIKDKPAAPSRTAAKRDDSYPDKNRYAAIIDGSPASYRHMLGMVEYLSDSQSSNPELFERFSAYLDKHTNASDDWTADILLQLITEEIPDTRVTIGLPAIAGFLDRFDDPFRYFRPALPEDIYKYAQWMYLDVGCRLLGRNKQHNHIFKAAEKFIGMPMDRYGDRLLKWHRVSPWSIAVGGSSLAKPSVVTVALPITHDQHGAISRGEINGFHLVPDKNESTSCYLFAEALSQRESRLLTKILELQALHLFGSAVIQQAILSDTDEFRDGAPLEVLAPCCFEDIGRWMKAMGYEPIGVDMHGTVFPLYKRHAWRGDEKRARSTWSGLQHLYRWVRRSRSDHGD